MKLQNILSISVNLDNCLPLNFIEILYVTFLVENLRHVFHYSNNL